MLNAPHFLGLLLMQIVDLGSAPRRRPLLRDLLLGWATSRLGNGNFWYILHRVLFPTHNPFALLVYNIDLILGRDHWRRILAGSGRELRVVRIGGAIWAVGLEGEPKEVEGLDVLRLFACPQQVQLLDRIDIHFRGIPLLLGKVTVRRSIKRQTGSIVVLANFCITLWGFRSELQQTKWAFWGALVSRLLLERVLGL